MGIRFGRFVCNAADVHDAADVFLYRDSSIAPLLDMRRRFRAVLNVLDSMISYGVTLGRLSLLPKGARSFLLGLFTLLSCMIFMLLRRIVGDLHRRLSDFIHGVVVYRRDEGIRAWRNWLREDPLVHPNKWLRPDLVPQLHFFSVSLILLLVVLESLLILLGLMRNSERLGFPTFVALGNLEEFDFEVEAWLPLLP